MADSVESLWDAFLAARTACAKTMCAMIAEPPLDTNSHIWGCAAEMLERMAVVAYPNIRVKTTALCDSLQVAIVAGPADDTSAYLAAVERWLRIAYENSEIVHVHNPHDTIRAGDGMEVHTFHYGRGSQPTIDSQPGGFDVRAVPWM